jgi:type II secretory pathway component GspD/PulD (secretin)
MQSGCFQGHQRKWKSFAAFLCVISIFLVIEPACWAQDGAERSVLRNRVYKLRHISAKDAKQRLISLRIGRNINELPHNSLIVESDNSTDLVKVSSLLKLIDAEQPFVIKTILTSPDIQKLPRNDQIAAKAGGITIGTFREPPTSTTEPVAIVDIHNSDLIAIAPGNLLDRIANAVEELRTPPPPVPQTELPANLPEPNALPVPPTKPSAELAEPNIPPAVQKATEEAQVPPLLEDEPAEVTPSQKTGVEEKDLSQAELLEMTAETEPRADTEEKQNKQEKGDFFGDELFETLAEAEKEAEERVVEQMTEELQPVEEPEESAEVLLPEKPNDRRAVEPEVKTTGISKEDLAAIARAEVAKLLKVGAVGEPNAPAPAQTPQLTVPAAQPPEKVEEDEEEEAEKQQEEEEIERQKPDEPKPGLPADEYRGRILDAEKEVELTLTLPEKVEVTALVEMVGKLLGLNYIYDEKIIKGDVMLKVHDGKVKVKDAYALLESVLKFRGFVMTRRGKLVTIIPQAQALDYDPTFRTSPKDIQPGDVIVTSIFHLKHVDTGSAEALLKSMKLGTIINSIPETGTLIVTGYAYRMGRIEELLEMIDVPGRPRKFQFRQLQYTVAAELVGKLKTLAEQLGTISITVSVKQTTTAPVPSKPQTAAERRTQAKRTTPPKTPAKRAAPAAQEGVFLDTDERTNRILMIGLAEDIDIVNQLIDTLDVETPDLRVIKEYEIQHVDPGEVIDTLNELGVVTTTSRTGAQRRTTTTPSKTTPTRTRTTAASLGGTGAPVEEEPQISVLEATNSLLINALPAQHAMIALVIAHVDREVEEATLPYVIYPLENQDPTELAEVLIKVIEKTTRAKAASAKDAKVQTMPTTTPSRLQEEITVVPDVKSYSLIVYASKKNQQWIGSLIKKLDEYRPQVLLDVTLVSISKYDEFGYDLDLITKFPTLAAGGSMDKLSALLSPVGGFPAKRITEATSFSGTGGEGFYADEHIQALLTLVQKKEYGRVLARPKLLVNDNEKGTIQTKNETTIVSPKTDVVPVQGGGGTSSTSISTQAYTSDITLDIQPHISKGDQLRLQITLNRTDFEGLGAEYSITVPGAVGTLKGPKPPDLITSKVETVITVPDGKTIILGGLEQIDQSKDGTKIPILGDIPIIGGLFRNISKTSDQTRLYVFVKAHILRPGEQLTGESDIIEASLENRATFEKYEKEMQEYEDWPGVKPEPMDPLKILEEDIELPQ